jgi:hypothetical protein
VTIKINGFMVWIVFSWQDFFGDFARHAVCATGQNVTNARPFSAFVPAAFDLMSGNCAAP